MVQQLLFIGQVLVVLLVYLFVWRVMRGARRDLALPQQHAGARGGRGVVDAQESTIISASDAASARRGAGLREPRLVVESSDVLRPGVP
ncbi:MAG: hypothetical protein JWO69_459, partial [Thermoleophilia bacterium]|nr:hypothetical protein [Thermoleophilia bacterium]